MILYIAKARVAFIIISIVLVLLVVDVYFLVLLWNEYIFGSNNHSPKKTMTPKHTPTFYFSPRGCLCACVYAQS